MVEIGQRVESLFMKMYLVDLQILLITGLLKEEVTSEAEPVDHVKDEK